MAKRYYQLTATQAYEVFRQRYAARKKAQALGAAWSVLANLSKMEHEAWTEYVFAKRRETPKGEQFILPSRPL